MPAARVAALRFVSPPARVAALRFDPSSFAQMSVARVSAARALRFASSSVSSASSAPSASSAASVTRQLNCYVSAEKRVFRRAA